MSDPIFKSIFGDQWDALPLVFKKHYANRPFTSDYVTVEGVLDVYCAGPIKWFAPLFRFLKGIPPCNEKNVPVTVKFRSCKDTRFFYFNRYFDFKKHKPYRFCSRMFQVEDNIVAEIMPFRVGWRIRYLFEDEAVLLKHYGYVLYIFGCFIPYR